nr:MAG TPA: hypothetical protein [Caudoviricetes sp.]
MKDSTILIRGKGAAKWPNGWTMSIRVVRFDASVLLIYY